MTLKLNKHENVSSNTNPFDIDKYLNENWDNILKYAENINTEITSIKETNEDQDKNIKENTKSIEEIKEEAAEIKAENVRLRSDINSIALIGEAEGESIDLDDSSDARFLEFGLGGNHKQETREGYNLYNYKNVQVGKKIDGNTGNIVGDYAFCFAGYIAVKENTKYIRSNVGTSTNLMMDKNKQSIGTISGEAFTTPSGCAYVAFNIRREKYEDGSYLKFVMNEGTELKQFEEYGASPSRDCPSEVETVGSNVNLFDKYSQDMVLKGLIPNNAGEIQAGSTNTSASNYLVTIIVPCLPNSTYIISRYVEGKTFFVYESSKKDLKVGDNVTFLKRNDNTGIINEKITTGENAKYLLVKIYNTYITEPNTYNDLISSVKVEKGTVATPWSPFGMGSVEIDVVNKNLYNGKTEIGGINNDGTLNNTTDRWRTIDYINVKNITNISINIYNITTTGSLGRYCFYDKNYNFLSSTQIINKNTIVNVSNVSYLKFWLLNDKVPSNAQIQVEADSIPTVCIQHQEQTVIMPVQQEKLKEDYFDFDREKEVHVMKKLVLKGTETIGRWTVVGNKGTEWRFAISAEGILRTSGPIEIANIICNKLKTTSAKNTYDKETGIAGEANSDVVIIYIEECKEMTVSEFNAYLKKQYDAGTPVIIYYKLATPIELDFTDEQKAVAKQIKETLHTYKNVTHIYSNDEVSPIFNIKYAKDPNVKNDNLQKQIDEIKQLLSTTQTSALLLDNLQKDVESEVE